MYGDTVDKLDLPRATKRGKWRRFHYTRKQHTFFVELILQRNLVRGLKQTYVNRGLFTENSPQTETLHNNSLVNGKLN